MQWKNSKSKPYIKYSICKHWSRSSIHLRNILECYSALNDLHFSPALSPVCCRNTTRQWWDGLWSVVSEWSRDRKDGLGEDCPQTQMDEQVRVLGSSFFLCAGLFSLMFIVPFDHWRASLDKPRVAYLLKQMWMFSGLKVPRLVMVLFKICYEFCFQEMISFIYIASLNR